MRLDLSSWQSVLATLASVALIAIVGVGIRVVTMLTIQQRRERANRQINERLRTLIAAYKVLGGSFTGDLTVDPTHLRDLRRARMAVAGANGDAIGREDGGGVDDGAVGDGTDPASASDRPRRIRDAVEGALSDIILLGTADQVRLAADAASELAAGRAVPTHALVVSLRDFIRDALDIDAVPGDVAMPRQGPARPAGGSGGPGASAGAGGRGGGGMGGGGTGGGDLGMGMGMAMGGGGSRLAGSLDDAP